MTPALATPASPDPVTPSVDPRPTPSAADRAAADRAAADRTAERAAALPVTDVVAVVSGGRSVTVTWARPPGVPATAAVTVCRTDGRRQGTVTAATCPAVATVPAVAGRYEDTTVRAGDTVSYAVLPAGTGSTTAGSASSTPGSWADTVTVPRPRRSAGPVRAAQVASQAGGGTASVSGTARSARGTALAGVVAAVVAVDPDTHRNTVTGSATTGTDGTYTITGLPAADGYYGATICFDAAGVKPQPTGGYVDTCQGDDVWDGLLDDVPFGNYLQLDDGVALTGVDVTVRSGGTVSGTVTGAGAPVAGASVYAVDGGDLFRALTAADGTYRLAGLPAGAVDVCVDATTAVVAAGSPGWAGQCRTGAAWAGGTVPSSATSQSVAVGSVTPGIDLALTPGGALAGVARSGSGVTLAGVDVYVAPASDSRLRYPSNGGGLASTGGGYDPLPTTTTDDAGRFAVTGLAPGSYLACFDASGVTRGAGFLSACAGGAPFSYPSYDNVAASATRFAVANGGVTDASVSLGTAAALSGTVTAATGGGLGGVRVTVSGGSYASTTTAASGGWSVRGLAPGGYTVCYDAAGAGGGTSTTGYGDQCHRAVTWDASTGVPANATAVAAKAGTTVTVPTAALPVAGAVGGTVTVGGQAVAGLSVTVYGSDGVRRYTHDALTDASGAYLVDGLAAGSYQVCAQFSGYAPGSVAQNAVPGCLGGTPYPGAAPGAGSPTVIVTAGAVTGGADLPLTTGAVLTGTVTDTTGAPVRDVDVTTYSPNGNSTSSVRTAADGTWAISGIDDASVDVCFNPAWAPTTPTGLLPECWVDTPWNGSSPQPAAATAVSTPPGSTTAHLDAVLGAAGAVSGRVVAAAGDKPVVAAAVTAYDPAGRSAASTTTASDGSFTVRGLATANYRVCVRGTTTAGDAASPGTAPVCARAKPWDGTAPAAGAQVFAVTAGTVASAATISAPTGAALRGTVTSTTGSALTGATVVVFSATSSYPVAYATTAPDGTYQAAPLQAGTYRVCAASRRSTPADGGAGYIPTCRGGVTWNGTVDGNPPSGIAATTLAAGSVSTGVDVVLPPGGALAGTVSDATSGAGIAFTTVLVFDDGGQVGLASTTSNGSWRATGMPAGNYAVCVQTPYYGPSPTGYLAGCRGGLQWSGSYNPPLDPPNVAVAAGTTTAADVPMTRAAGLTGKVVSTGAAAAPVSNASIVVYGTDGQPTGGWSVSTAADGTWATRSLAPGTYRVCVDARNGRGPAPAGYLSRCYGSTTWVAGTTPPTGTTSVTATSGVAKSVGTLALVPGSALAGTITDATTNALVTGSVTVFDANGNSVGGAYTGGVSAATGWQVSGLPAGRYRVCASASTYGNDAPAGYRPTCYRGVAWGANAYAVPAGATALRTASGAVTGSVTVALPRASGISGVVSDAVSRAGIVGAAVRVFKAGTSSAVNYYSYDRTGTAGAYLVTGLDPGKYVVCFDASTVTTGTGYFSRCFATAAWDGGWSSPPSDARLVTTTAGAIRSGISGTLDPSAAISGRVTAAAGGSGLGFVTALVTQPGLGMFTASAQTDSAGNYVVGGLTAGTYQVCFQPTSWASTGTGYRSQCYSNVAWDSSGAVPSGATTVTTTAGATTTGVDAALASAGAVAGTVTDAQGTGLGGVQVSLFRGTRYVTTGYAYGGAYRVIGLTPGAYTVCFSGMGATGGSSTGGYLSECHDDVAWDGGGTPPTGVTTVNVQAKATAAVSAVLAAGAGVGGTVRDAASGNGLSLYGIRVFAADGTQLDWTGSATDGSWSLTGLVPGSTVTVCIGSTSANGVSYASQCWNHLAWDEGSSFGYPAPGSAGVTLSSGALTGGVDFDLTAV